MKLRASLLSLLLIFALLLPCLVACGPQDVDTPEDTAITTSADTTTPPALIDINLNNSAIENYSIVYSASELDFNLRAAEYVKDEILKLTGKELSVKLDTEAAETDLEILVGLTNRAASADAASAELGDFEFIASAKGTQIVLYGEEYMVAAAAYNFINKAVLAHDNGTATLAEDFAPKAPEFETPNNFILLIGDGMGFNSLEYGEDLFIAGTYLAAEYSNLPHYNVAARLPYKATSHTTPKGADTVTDSAAGGTALATGYKTYNGVIGLNTDFEPVKNLSELAIEKGMMTAVLTTDEKTGATPSAFSSHAYDRDDGDDIAYLQDASGIDLIMSDIYSPETALRKAFTMFEDAEDGFFMMYEEAYIDKSSHDNSSKGLYNAYTKLNTALRAIMEYMMYNPDTLLILTADHETGGLTWNEDKASYEYTTGSHTGVNVPFYALGKGVEHIDGNSYENVYIAKLIAKLMGEDNFGDSSISDTTDATGLETLTDDEAAAAAAKEEADRTAYKLRKSQLDQEETELRQSYRDSLFAAD